MLRAMQEYLVQTTEKKYLAADIVELSVALVRPKSMKFRAGQFVFFDLGGPYKAYTITSLPRDNHRLRFLIKLEPGGQGSKFVSGLSIGRRFTVTGPEGYFTVRQRTGKVCLVALGIGLAPFLSIIPALLEKQFKGNIVLLYGYRAPASGVYSDYLRELAATHKNFSFLNLSSRQQRLSDYLKENCRQYPGYRFYVCGKRQAVAGVEAALAEQGVGGGRITTEVFLK